MRKISTDKNLKIEQIFNSAVENYEKKNFEDAKNLYQKILKVNPNHTEANYNLGLIFQQFKKYIKAKNFYEKAIQIKPNYVAAHNNLGLVFKELEDMKNAKRSYEKAIKIDPNCVSAIFNLGIVFRELGEFQKSLNCYQSVIKIKPNFAKAHNNIGNVYKKLGKDNKAIDHFERALKLNPNSIDSQVNISNVYINQLSDLKKATNASYKALKMFQEKSEFINQSIPLYRLKHDLQQAEYLYSQNHKVTGIDQFMKIGSQILKRKENIKNNNENNNNKIFLKNDEINHLLPFYKANYIYRTSELSESCINPKKNWKEVEEEYFTSSNQIIYIDNFLSNQAVNELRKFCLLSKIWTEERNNKYLGSFSDKGFISSLHLKIAIELRNKLPKLFGKNRLGRFWAFKYDSSLGRGINIHADFAAINLNFWITPDEFNNNKKGGGLKVYDTPAPQNWTFKKYNINAQEIYKLLKKDKANCTNVPYKFNRAVLFNSDYFHETDKINFKDSYEASRINITYLFGDRLFKKKTK